MRYANARYEESRKELAYRIYITDVFRAFGEGKATKIRFYDILYPQPVDNRNPTEIAYDILSAAGVEVKKDNG